MSSEHAVLEATTFRIPYEELNSKYRNGHKNMEKSTAAVKKFSQQVRQLVDGKGEPMPIEQIKAKFQALTTSFNELQATFEKSMNGQKEIVQTMIKRLNNLKEEDEPQTSGEVVQTGYDKQKIIRYIVNYLLRCGHITSATKLAERYNLEHMVDVDVFIACRKIREALLAGKTGPCLEWIEIHRSKLRRMKSRLESTVRQQDVIDLILQDKSIEALKYVRRNISPYSKNDDHCDIQLIMGIIGMGRETLHPRFHDLSNPSRWETVAEAFTEQFFALYQLTRHSQFSMCLQVGLSAYKTPSCKYEEGKKTKCIVCSKKAWPIAENLPVGNVGQSRILCSFSGEVCDDFNEPFLLPSGYVAGTNAIKRALDKDKEIITNPNTGEKILFSQCQRLYFL